MLSEKQKEVLRELLFSTSKSKFETIMATYPSLVSEKPSTAWSVICLELELSEEERLRYYDSFRHALHRQRKKAGGATPVHTLPTPTIHSQPKAKPRTENKIFEGLPDRLPSKSEKPGLQFE